MNFSKWNEWKGQRRLKKLIEAELPEMKQYIGERIKVKDSNGRMITTTIKTLTGSITKPHFYEINGMYLVNALRFHAFFTGDTSIAEQQFRDFEEIEWEAVKNSDHDILTAKLEKTGIIF